MRHCQGQPSTDSSLGDTVKALANLVGTRRDSWKEAEEEAKKEAARVEQERLARQRKVEEEWRSAAAAFESEDEGGGKEEDSGRAGGEEDDAAAEEAAERNRLPGEDSPARTAPRQSRKGEAASLDVVRNS